MGEVNKDKESAEKEVKPSPQGLGICQNAKASGRRTCGGKRELFYFYYYSGGFCLLQRMAISLGAWNVLENGGLGGGGAHYSRSLAIYCMSQALLMQPKFTVIFGRHYTAPVARHHLGSAWPPRNHGFNFQKYGQDVVWDVSVLVIGILGINKILVRTELK